MQNNQSQKSMAQPFNDILYYKVTEGGYSFFKNGKEVGKNMANVALLMDKKRQAILCHGAGDLVQQRFVAIQQLYVDSGYASDEVIMLEGPFSVAELNAAINVPERAGDLFRKYLGLQAIRADEVAKAFFSRMQAGKVGHLPLH